MLKEIQDKLQGEINELDYELRISLPKAIQQARELGDLRENAEYKSALDRQEIVRARLGQLKKRLGELATMDHSRLPRDRAALGSQVALENADTGEKVSYKLVLPEVADPDRGWVSVSSPIGQGLVNHEEGDDVVIRTPRGVKRWTIVSLKTVHDQE